MHYLSPRTVDGTAHCLRVLIWIVLFGINSSLAAVYIARLSHRHSGKSFRADSGTRPHRRLELLIPLVDEDDARLKAARFSIIEIRVSNDDDLVARHRESRSRAVQPDDTGAGRRFDDVGRKTRAGVDIVDIDALVEEKAGSLDQRPID